MGIIDKKRNVFSKLSAISALGDLPKPNFNSSKESINNKLSSTDFLVDFTTALVGIKDLRDYVIDTLTNRLPELELIIKDGLKRELKELVSCNLNPSIPTWFQSGGTGVQLSVTDVDFYDIMKTNPTSVYGGLIYTDIAPGVNSTDFNTYLYNTIQTPSTPTNWGSFGGAGGADILETTFYTSILATTTKPARNNIIKYTTSGAYSTKTLPDFNNAFIDTLSLFGSPGSMDSARLIALIMEELFGSISSAPGINKDKKQIEKELEFKEVLDNILNSEDSNITDNFFEFDNPTLARIDRESNNRRNGIRELVTCENLPVQITAQVVNDVLSTVVTATTKADETKAVTNALDNLADTQAGFSTNDSDKETIRGNFIIEIIRKLQTIAISTIVTPEFISLFAINHQIIYGQDSTYDGPIDFMKKNRKLIKNIAKIINNMLLNMLLNLALLYVTKKLKEKFAGDQIEKAKNYVSILLSYTGVPPELIAQIRKVNTQAIPNYN